MSVHEFELTDEETRSPVWMKMRAYLQDELDKARVSNDAILGDEETNLLRGKIRALKNLLKLGGPTSPPVI